MSGLRVLLTNITLASRTGTEINVRDLAISLLREGHHPVVYSPVLGSVAEEIRAATVPVVRDLASVGIPPDVIHGHHHPQTMAALLHFPGVPAVFFAHDWNAWWDVPPRFPRIYLYVAVDDLLLDRLALEEGLPRERLRVLLNAVDLARFVPRDPLPAKPRRALLFSHTASRGEARKVVEAACGRAGIPLDVAGAGAGWISDRPEKMLARYDLVFARGRCALEALAAGAAVVLCGVEGAGGLVTSTEVGRLRRLNFGRRALTQPLAPDVLDREIGRYDAADAEQASRRVREEASLETATGEALALYREVIEEHGRRGPVDPAEEGAATAAYLEKWGPRLGDRFMWTSGVWTRDNGGFCRVLEDAGRGLRRRLRRALGPRA